MRGRLWLWVLAGLIATFFLLPAATRPQTCGDPDGNGVDLIDAANVLRAAVGLSSTCAASPVLCDVDASGRIDLVDAANALRLAVRLPAADACFPSLRLTAIGEFTRPLFLDAPPGDRSRLFVVEQGGTIRVVVDGAIVADPFLDVSGLITPGGRGEQGLLGFAFHPDYAINGRFFIHYTDRAGDTVVAEYARSAGDPNRAAPDAVRTLVAVDQPFANHNGGRIAFGPDGFLYVGLGDGGGGGDPNGNGQRLDTKLGKILRLDVDGGGPPPGNLPGGDPDIWDLGLRNPFRFSFDRANGDLYIGDVGQNAFEEIDYEPAGTGRRNYGWDVLEGLHCFDPPSGCDTTGTVAPIVEYGHELGCAVIGGYVYRGEAIPALVGRYLYSDFCSSRVWSFVVVDGVATNQVELTATLDPGGLLGNVTSFGEDAAGELYVVDQLGSVFRIDPE